MLIPITAEKKGKVINIFVNEGDLINEGDNSKFVLYFHNDPLTMTGS